MKATSNNLIAILIVIFIVSFSLEVSIYVIKFEKKPVVGKALVGFVGFCIDNFPTINYIGDQEAWVGQNYYYDVNITPADDNATFYDDTYLFDINNQTGVISFTPNQSQVGVHYVNISIKNTCGRTVDFEIVQFTIHGENQAPYFDPPLPDNFTIYQNDHFVYDVNATDPDNDSLIFGENTGMFDIDPYTGLIDFIPAQDDVGNHSVLIWVIDEHGAMDSKNVLFEIIDVNDPPVLEPIGAQTAFINKTYYYDVNATDVDTQLPHNLTYYDNTTLFDINPSTGEINFTPTDADNGTYSINISVTDGELWDWEVISFTVTKENHPPVITSWYPYNHTIEMDEGDSQNFWITKYDPDDTIPSTQWYLDSVKLRDQTNDYFIYIGTAGTHNVTVIISDGILTDSHEWEVIVKPRPGARGGAGVSAAAAPPPVCIENWRCTEWPPCPPYGIQVRRCWDLNKCGTFLKKPPESQPCIYVPEPSCSDNIKNCHHGSCEILTDCGGPCPPCPTCNDGIKNCHKDGSCEEGIDCGGPCPPCKAPEKPYIACGDGICAEDELFTCLKDCYAVLGRYVITGILITFVFTIMIAKRKTVVIKYKRLKKYIEYKRKKKPPFTDKQILGLSTLRRIYSIRSKIGKEKTRDLFELFSKTMREFFAKFFGIKYEFTYVELNEEINKIKMKKEIKNNIINFSIKISEMEYGGFEITAANFLDIIKMAIPLVEELTGVKLEQAVKEKIEIKEEKKEEIVKKPIKEVKIEEIEEMKKLINEAENAIENNDIDTATELYSKIKTIYEKIPPEKKKELYSESIRIIKLYNNIIRSIS